MPMRGGLIVYPALRAVMSEPNCGKTAVLLQPLASAPILRLWLALSTHAMVSSVRAHPPHARLLEVLRRHLARLSFGKSTHCHLCICVCASSRVPDHPPDNVAWPTKASMVAPWRISWTRDRQILACPVCPTSQEGRQWNECIPHLLYCWWGAKLAEERMHAAPNPPGDNRGAAGERCRHLANDAHRFERREALKALAA